jgi:hypothetical protein
MQRLRPAPALGAVSLASLSIFSLPKRRWYCTHAPLQEHHQANHEVFPKAKRTNVRAVSSDELTVNLQRDHPSDFAHWGVAAQVADPVGCVAIRRGFPRRGRNRLCHHIFKGCYDQRNRSDREAPFWASLGSAGYARSRLRLAQGRFVVGRSRAFLFMLAVVQPSVRPHAGGGTFMPLSPLGAS